MIQKESIDEVLSVAQVDEVVGEFVDLKKRGANYLGLCPFHDEKTPSFTVSPSKGIYKCFGCGKGGGAVNFVMEHEQMSYPEAIRWLANKYNIELKETQLSEEEKVEADKRESIFIVNNFAKDHFKDNLLNSDEGKSIALPYFKERGFTEKTIEAFDLGYSMRSGKSLTELALSNGYKLEILKQAGLVREKDDRKYDFFRERVMFPIHNLTGRVIAFGGRILRSNEKAPKYVNTPESEVYVKSKILYGAFQAKKAVREKENCFLVEGYTDVISLYQAGIENVMASSGTSLTADQVRLVRRFTPKVTLLYDGDPAGIKAAIRGVDIILEQGLEVKVVVLPEGEDPDSYVNSLGAQAFLDFVEKESKDFILFKADQLLPEGKADPVKKAEVIKDLVSSISIIPDPIRRSIYINECSGKLGIEESLLITEVNKTRKRHWKDQKKITEQEEQILQHQLIEDLEREPQSAEGPGSVEKAEKEMVRALLEFGTELIEPDYYAAIYILEEAEDFEWTNPRYAKIIDYYRIEIQGGKLPLPGTILSHEDQEIMETAINLTMSPYQVSQKWFDRHSISTPKREDNFKKDLEEVTAHFKVVKVKALIDREREILKKGGLSADEEAASLQKIQKWTKFRNELSLDRGRNTIH